MVEIGLLDATFGDTMASFRAQVQGLAERLARHPDVSHWLEQKRRERARDEQVKPLVAYRTEEMPPRTSASSARTAATTWRASLFVYKTGAPCTVQVPVAAGDRSQEQVTPDEGPSKVRRAKQSVAP